MTKSQLPMTSQTRMSKSPIFLSFRERVGVRVSSVISLSGIYWSLMLGHWGLPPAE